MRILIVEDDSDIDGLIVQGPGNVSFVRMGEMLGINPIVGANFDSTVLTQRNAYGYDRNVNRSVIVTTGAVTVPDPENWATM